MESILTAAFLVFLGSQAPCPTSYSERADVIFISPLSVPTLGRKLDVLPVASEAELRRVAAEEWLGAACDYSIGPNETVVDVLDVRAGRWLKVTQTRETKKTVVEKEERTGKLKVQIQ